jgi:hypothetical protein
MRWLVWGLVAVLGVIAGLHLYWGLGGVWPGTDETSLVDMVIGAPPGTPIPPLWACALVAACLCTSAISAILVSGVVRVALPKWISWAPSVAFWFSAFVFVARGLSTYFSPLALGSKGTAFYELDRIVYAPLCLTLGAALIVIWLLRAKSV